MAMGAILDHPVWLDQVSQRWREVLADKSLHDLPYKVETNRSGQVVMSPAKNIHGAYQAHVSETLHRVLGGRVLVECSIATPEGVKVADVAWCSNAFIAERGYEDPYSVAPEICVEIKSPSNARAELMNKVRLYLDAGAKEVWLVDDQGGVTMHDVNGSIATSAFGVSVPPMK